MKVARRTPSGTRCRHEPGGHSHSEITVDVPLEIAFRNVDPTDSLRELVREGVDALEKVHPRLSRAVG
jgi:hypothetical protein